MLDKLFSQEQVVEMVANEAREEGEKKGREEGGIKHSIIIYKEFGKTKKEAMEYILSKFNLSRDSAMEKINQYWNKKY